MKWGRDWQQKKQQQYQTAKIDASSCSIAQGSIRSMAQSAEVCFLGGSVFEEWWRVVKTDLHTTSVKTDVVCCRVVACAEE